METPRRCRQPPGPRSTPRHCGPPCRPTLSHRPTLPSQDSRDWVQERPASKAGCSHSLGPSQAPPLEAGNRRGATIEERGKKEASFILSKLAPSQAQMLPTQQQSPRSQFIAGQEAQVQGCAAGTVVNLHRKLKSDTHNHKGTLVQSGQPTGRAESFPLGLMHGHLAQPESSCCRKTAAHSL